MFEMTVPSHMLGAVDKASSQTLRPAACPLELEIGRDEQAYYAEIDRYGCCEKVVGRLDLNQPPLNMARDLLMVRRQSQPDYFSCFGRL